MIIRYELGGNKLFLGNDFSRGIPAPIKGRLLDLGMVFGMLPPIVKCLHYYERNMQNLYAAHIGRAQALHIH